MRITCDRCGKDRVISETHTNTAQRDMPIRDIIKRMRHDGYGGRAGEGRADGRCGRSCCCRRDRHAPAVWLARRAGRAGASRLGCDWASLSAHAAQSGDRLRADRAICGQPLPPYEGRSVSAAGDLSPAENPRVASRRHRQVARSPLGVGARSRSRRLCAIGAAVRLTCRHCGCWRHADLQKLIDEGWGDVPLIHLRRTAGIVARAGSAWWWRRSTPDHGPQPRPVRKIVLRAE
jgi:hypothetical protein